MIINKVKEYKQGLRLSKSVMENLTDLMYMIRSKPTNIKAEAQRIENQNKVYAKVAKEIFAAVEKIVKEPDIKCINIYITEQEYDIYKTVIGTYTNLVNVETVKSNSIKGGYTCRIKPK